MCVKNNTVCSWWEIDSLNCLPGSNPAQVDLLTSRLSARHAAGEKLIPRIFLPARTRHEWTYLGSNTPPRSYKHKSGNHENYSSILNGTVLITVRNAIAARSCFQGRLWFLFTGGGGGRHAPGWLSLGRHPPPPPTDGYRNAFLFLFNFVDMPCLHSPPHQLKLQNDIPKTVQKILCLK